MRLLRNILALAPCGKPQGTHFAHVTALLQWLPGRLNFTGLEPCGGRSARTHVRWFARPFPSRAWPWPRWGRCIRGCRWGWGRCWFWTPASCPRAGTGPRGRGLNDSDAAIGDANRILHSAGVWLTTSISR